MTAAYRAYRPHKPYTYSSRYFLDYRRAFDVPYAAVRGRSLRTSDGNALAYTIGDVALSVCRMVACAR
jgi:hypothetical protein